MKAQVETEMLWIIHWQTSVQKYVHIGILKKPMNKGDCILNIINLKDHIVPCPNSLKRFIKGWNSRTKYICSLSHVILAETFEVFKTSKVCHGLFIDDRNAIFPEHFDNKRRLTSDVNKMGCRAKRSLGFQPIPINEIRVRVILNGKISCAHRH